MRTVRAAAVQLSPVLYSREGTVDKVVRTIDDSGRRECSSPRSRKPSSLTTHTFRSSSPPTRSLPDLSTSSCSIRR